MAVLVDQKLDGVTREMYDGVNARLNAQANPPAGLILHSSHATEGGWRIVDVWETAEAYQQFAEERIGPAVMAYTQEAGIEPRTPETTITGLYDVIRP
jgi:hypothetical protein